MKMILVGSIVIESLGLLFLSYIVRHYRRKRKLMENGLKLYATIAAIKVDTHKRYKGGSPHYLECSWEDEQSNNRRVFCSENTYEDYSYAIGTTIEVYFNPVNPREYYVDLDSILA